MRLSQSPSKDHLSAVIASNAISVVAATRGRKGSGVNAPKENFWFSAIYFGNIMLAISDKGLLANSADFLYIRVTLRDGLDDISMFDIYHLPGRCGWGRGG